MTREDAVQEAKVAGTICIIAGLFFIITAPIELSDNNIFMFGFVIFGVIGLVIGAYIRKHPEKMQGDVDGSENPNKTRQEIHNETTTSRVS